MPDYGGDKSKQPDYCKDEWILSSDPVKAARGEGYMKHCPNLKEDGGGFSGERYKCEVCGKSYFLDYDEMK